MSTDAPGDARGIDTTYPCIFRTALLARRAVCELAALRAHAESQTVACSVPQAHASCGALYRLLREKSAFALKQLDADAAIPHALAMKLECGGLQGMQQALDIPGTIPDVWQLLGIAQDRHASLEELPFEQIVGTIARWQGRRPAKRRSDPAEKL